MLKNLIRLLAIGPLVIALSFLGNHEVRAQELLTIETDLQDDVAKVRLEVVLYKPAGEGPHPLLVFNHGSTGDGDSPILFRLTERYPAVGKFFADRGWMVAVPQRRGRGRSEGLYDEGFGLDRKAGYSCLPRYALPGAERALKDIQAAIAVLVRRSDVRSDLVLIGGNSRGGILAVAYAGRHPRGIVGVINFVGGWVTDRCKEASKINGALSVEGAQFPRSMLWLYATNDTFYSMEHSRQNFARFRQAGGRGVFHELKVPSGDGHELWKDWLTWARPVDEYLKEITGNRRQVP